ncbi:DUF1641 domain-containing protein [Metabacillus sp. 113a]|uniref:DUF1641 domain-containing protein n=1 Tax=Metabacillus sp. 113a TaxID=3404706 RepID=UPI003CF25AAA
MANAINKIKKLELSEEEKRKKELMEMQEALVDNKSAILESLKLMRHMEDKGILPLLNGLVGQGDKVLNVFVKATDKEENTNALRNLLLMVGMLGTINVKELEPILLKMNRGIERVAEQKDTDKKTGLFELLKSLRDPEVNRAITLMLTFLKGVGEETGHKEKNTGQESDERAEIKNR